jgi:hypothetical protein
LGALSRCRRLGVFEILIVHCFLLLNPTGESTFSSLQFKQRQALHPREEPPKAAEWYSGRKAFTDPIRPRRGRGVSPHCKGQYKVALSHIAHLATTKRDVCFTSESTFCAQQDVR